MDQKIRGIAWALFLIWIGLALIVGISVSVSLLVVGCITLAAQVARRSFGLALEVGWLIIGGLFVIGGLCGLLGVSVPLLPIVIVVAGVVLLISTLSGKRSDEG